MNQLTKAIEFANECHKGQSRKHNGLPYITHPLSVMNLLIEIGVYDKDILSAAVLHDVVEDCDLSNNKEWDRQFNDNVFKYVMECTHTEQNYAGKNRQEKVDCYMKFLRTVSESGKLIKLADRICNLREYVRDWAFLNDSDQRFVRDVYYNESSSLYDSLFIVTAKNRFDHAKKQLLYELDKILYKLANL